MESVFKIGEIVVCVNATKIWYSLGGLRKNGMYTVKSFNSYDGGLILEEVKSSKGSQYAFRANRFRKVDYNFAENIIAHMVLPAIYELNAPRIKISNLNK